MVCCKHRACLCAIVVAELLVNGTKKIWVLRTLRFPLPKDGLWRKLLRYATLSPRLVAGGTIVYAHASGLTTSE